MVVKSDLSPCSGSETLTALRQVNLLHKNGPFFFKKKTRILVDPRSKIKETNHLGCFLQKLQK